MGACFLLRLINGKIVFAVRSENEREHLELRADIAPQIYIRRSNIKVMQAYKLFNAPLQG